MALMAFLLTVYVGKYPNVEAVAQNDRGFLFSCSFDKVNLSVTELPAWENEPVKLCCWALTKSILTLNIFDSY